MSKVNRLDPADPDLDDAPDTGDVNLFLFL
ncbi:hypothetical protein J2S45_002052 [Trueperella abortisuis]|uniref:Uncharacterized protein n=1 Tax=Trueperella abortisuis TaxID=445930 RepID=A0ABT9PL02_9ACTO|nr:hypothetical protein [Trueperella abortisuis]